MKKSARASADLEEFFFDVVSGLSAIQKFLPPKYFYDEIGSNLFEKICETPEYYPTRTEKCILKRYASDLANQIGPNAVVLEYGSGSLEKIKILLDTLERPTAIIPVDVSHEQLVANSTSLSKEYPHILFFPINADFTKELFLPEIWHQSNNRLAFFPGSTIGNFEPEAAKMFLLNVAKTLGRKGALLIGFDLIKDATYLKNAYNDETGFTAAFNKNILTRINRELGANFNVSAFQHLAYYNTLLKRVEMHLKSKQKQAVVLGSHTFTFERNETIHTENCYKYDVPTFIKLAKRTKLYVRNTWIDDDKMFAVMLLGSKLTI